MKITNTSKKNHAVVLDGLAEPLKPGKSVDVEGLDLKNPIVKAWIKAGIIKVEGTAAAPAVPQPLSASQRGPVRTQITDESSK